MENGYLWGREKNGGVFFPDLRFEAGRDDVDTGGFFSGGGGFLLQG